MAEDGRGELEIHCQRCEHIEGQGLRVSAFAKETLFIVVRAFFAQNEFVTDEGVDGG